MHKGRGRGRGRESQVDCPLSRELTGAGAGLIS